jgi:sugar (pentulose or hexulose) kinase
LTASQGALHVGIDVGTSGVRAVAIDRDGAVRGQTSRTMAAPVVESGTVTQEPAVWRDAVAAVLSRLGAEVDLGAVASIGVDGTSGTLLLADADGRPLAPARMYDDQSAAQWAPRIADVAPPESGAHGATSALGRLLHLQASHPEARHALHQADWLAARLTGRCGLSD